MGTVPIFSSTRTSLYATQESVQCEIGVGGGRSIDLCIVWLIRPTKEATRWCCVPLRSARLLSPKGFMKAASSKMQAGRVRKRLDPRWAG
jgi:hypothetical protein